MVDLKDGVIFITGATAGVGRASARAFARRGTKIALLAREERALADTKEELETIGAQVWTVSADVADEDAMLSAARNCEGEFGPIEVWINNAMTTVIAPVSELTPKEVRRITDVCYLGYVNGTMAALEHMVPRDRGVIVQVGSALAYRGIPLQAPYCAAKHAVRGFTDSLRVELLHSRSGIALTAVHLPAINTPQFGWARSKTGRLPRPVAPVFAPEVAARAIVHAARHPQREYWLGGSTLKIGLANMLAPWLLDRMLAKQAISGQMRTQKTETSRPDNLYQPVPTLHSASGAFSSESKSKAVNLAAPALRIGAFLLPFLLAAGIGMAAGTQMCRGRVRDR